MGASDIASAVATLLERVNHHTEMLERKRARIDGAEMRIAKLENWRWFVAGGLALLAVEIPVAVTMAVKWAAVAKP